jgi:hypothetical protein
MPYIARQEPEWFSVKEWIVPKIYQRFGSSYGREKRDSGEGALRSQSNYQKDEDLLA